MNAPSLDFRPYAGQRLIVGEGVCKDVLRPPVERSWYILGPWREGEDFPAHVKAIILDDAEDASELLFVVEVAADGRASACTPLVVDDRGRLRDGAEFFAGVVESGIRAPATFAMGVHLEEAPTP